MKTVYRRVVNLVEDLSPVWVERLGLGNYELQHVFLDTFDTISDAEDDYLTTAMTESRWQYMQAKIKWYLPVAATKEDADLERVLVHELVHVMLAPEQSLVFEQSSIHAETDGLTADDANKLTTRYSELLELSTECVTRALLKATWD